LDGLAPRRGLWYVSVFRSLYNTKRGNNKISFVTLISTSSSSAVVVSWLKRQSRATISAADGFGRTNAAHSFHSHGRPGESSSNKPFFLVLFTQKWTGVSELVPGSRHTTVQNRPFFYDINHAPNTMPEFATRYRLKLHYGFVLRRVVDTYMIKIIMLLWNAASISGSRAIPITSCVLYHFHLIG